MTDGQRKSLSLAVFKSSLGQSNSPPDWLHSLVPLIFKKGECYLPKNYRPVSLTCILCNLLEHIIVSKTNSWIASFLSNHQQAVVLDGATSTINRSVYQVSVLRPFLFLIYINDLPRHLDSKVRLFADNCIMYRNIRSTQDCRALQTDIDRLEAWETKWKMKFNTDKCECLRVTHEIEKAARP